MTPPAALILAIAALGLCAGCARVPITPSPSSAPAQTPAAIPRFELTVADAVAYFEQYSMECLGPDKPFVDTREWLCEQDNISSTNTVRVIGDAAGVSQLIGISEGVSADDAISFLLGVVVSAVVPQAEAEEMTHRTASQPELPGAWHLGGASVELQAHSDARAVIVNPLMEQPRR